MNSTEFLTFLMENGFVAWDYPKNGKRWISLRFIESHGETAEKVKGYVLDAAIDTPWYDDIQSLFTNATIFHDVECISSIYFPLEWEDIY